MGNASHVTWPPYTLIFINHSHIMIYSDSLDFLCDIYEVYLTENSLPKISADEQDLSAMTVEQGEWITNFSNLWEKVQNA